MVFVLACFRPVAVTSLVGEEGAARDSLLENLLIRAEREENRSHHLQTKRQVLWASALTLSATVAALKNILFVYYFLDSQKYLIGNFFCLISRNWRQKH